MELCSTTARAFDAASRSATSDSTGWYQNIRSPNPCSLIGAHFVWHTQFIKLLSHRAKLRIPFTHLELRVITKYALCVIVGHSLSTSRRSDWWSIIAPSPQPVGLGSLPRDEENGKQSKDERKQAHTAQSHPRPPVKAG